MDKLLSAVFNAPLWVAILAAIAIFVVLLFLPELWGSGDELLSGIGLAAIAGYFLVRIVRNFLNQDEERRMRRILVALGALHVLGLVSYFTLPFGYQTGRSLYEELYEVDFWVFPGIFAATWALISVLVLLRYRAIEHAGATRTLRFLSIGVCIVLAVFAFGAISLVPPALGIFASFGADLPGPTLLVMAAYKAWPVVPVLGAIAAGIVVMAAGRRHKMVKLAFNSLTGLLVLANVFLFGTLGALFLPFFTLCGETRLETGFTRLHAAAFLGREESVQRLLARGMAADAADDTGSTPLYLAVGGGHFAVAQVLVAKGANVNAGNERGVTPLYVAVNQGRIEIAKWLLASGARAASATDAGVTPLHGAAIRGHADLAALLLANGADVNAEDNQGKTPLDWAHDMKQGAVIAPLAAHGGTRSTKESRQRRTEQPKSQSARAPSSHSCGSV